MQAASDDTATDARVGRHAALADPLRLAIVDELAMSDRSPIELRARLGVESNLLAHHLDVLEHAGLITRTRSSGDRRRRYVHLVSGAFDGLGPRSRPTVGRALFVCTRNSARSHLAAALWRTIADQPAESAGTMPAERVHHGAIAAARRAGLRLPPAAPRSIDQVRTLPPLIVTVCDQAHEELAPAASWLHWSIPDPVAAGTAAAFDDAVRELRRRVVALSTGAGSR